MERAILFLVLLTGMMLMLYFFHAGAKALKCVLIRIPKRTAAPEVVSESRIHWRRYDIPACRRRPGFSAAPAKNAEASFEVIA